MDQWGTIRRLNIIFFGLMTIHLVSAFDFQQIEGFNNDNPLQLNRTLTIVGKRFMLSGTQPLHIISGEFHYFRTPAAYWKQILTKLKLAGLNSVSTYVEWSFHEPEERKYDFSGDRDVAQFIRTAAEVGLYVLLRPGPYICAERDLGGLPYWLLGKYNQIVLRSLDQDYISESKKWLNKLFEQLSPLLYGNGGPIILVQVENEFGNYGNNKPYMTEMANHFRLHVNDKAILYTADGSSNIQNDFLTNSSFAAVNFKPDIVKVSEAFKELNKSGGPLMVAELYTGWFSEWGLPVARLSTDVFLKTLKECLDKGVHVNFYMFFGGTNYEFTSGAVKSKTANAFRPLLTSYDYGAPLNEAGDPTKKYFAIRQLLEKYFPEVKSLPLPSARAMGAYGKVTMKPKVGLLSRDGRAMLSTVKTIYRGSALPTFEDLRQRSALVLYEINITSKLHEQISPNRYLRNAALIKQNILHIERPRDYIDVFVNGFKLANLSRNNSKHRAKFSAYKDFTLSLLVENQGRIHFIMKEEADRKVTLTPVLYVRYLAMADMKMKETNKELSSENPIPVPSTYSGHLEGTRIVHEQIRHMELTPNPEYLLPSTSNTSRPETPLENLPYVDPDCPYIGATPDGRVGDNMIVEGILSKVRLNYGVLKGNWTITGFNLENLNVKSFNNFITYNTASLNIVRGPLFYEGTFKIMQTPQSTFLNTKGWGKGIVWINGHNLGRYWASKGPQLTLFVPGVWLKAVPLTNVIQILEMERPFKQLSIEFVPKPIYYQKMKKEPF